MEKEGAISGDSARITRSLFQEGDGSSNLTSPLQFEIREIKPQFASNLNELWHSRLPKIHWSNITRNRHYVCYGAVHSGKVYAVGIWSSPVAANRMKNGNKILELRRLAICDEAPKNTASRMLSIMRKFVQKKFPEIVKLISYQDTEIHRGTIYKADNWKPANRTKFMRWDKTRDRAKPQSMADKIRWEYVL